MALFGKKKKEKPLGNEEEFDEFAISDEDDIFSAPDPAPNYDDDIGDDFDDEMNEESEGHSQRKPQSEKMSLGSKIGVGVLVVIVALFAASQLGVFDAMTPTSQEQSQGENENSSSDEEGDMGEGVVVDESVGKSYVGSDNGNPINGTGAIMSFTYHYYTSRDGEKAREVFNPDAKSYDSQYIQNHIDEVPEGTKYEITITPRTIGSFYDGVIKMMTPDGGTHEFNISYETMEKDGKFFVKTFSQKENKENSNDNKGE